MSQMPDKIWLHKDTKYSTGDEVSGYQYKFLAEEEGIENFVEYVPSDALIEKGCEFIETYPHLFMGVLRSEAVADFKNYMKGE